MERLKGIALGLVVLAWASAPPPQAKTAPTPAPEPYVFVPDVSRLVGIYLDDWLLVGRLDAAGNFLKTESRKRGEAPPAGCAMLNDTGGQSRRAYEYRSGMLIWGVLDTEGNFVPADGSTIVLFRDYKYTPEAPTIWNLPGRFVKRSTLHANEKEKKGEEKNGREP